MKVTMGVAIGSSRFQAVLVAIKGPIVRTAQCEHQVQRQHFGPAEMDAAIRWSAVSAVSHALADRQRVPSDTIGKP